MAEEDPVNGMPSCMAVGLGGNMLREETKINGDEMSPLVVMIVGGRWR